jgi:hypothetical protein
MGYFKSESVKLTGEVDFSRDHNSLFLNGFEASLLLGVCILFWLLFWHLFAKMSVAGSYQVNVPVAKPSTQPQQKASKTQAVSPAISLIAGALGGATEATVTVRYPYQCCVIRRVNKSQYPFEFAKTRAQLNPGNSVKNVSVSKNPFTVIAQTARQDGVRAIYTGCSTLILVGSQEVTSLNPTNYLLGHCL